MEFLLNGFVLLVAGLVVWSLWRAREGPRLFIVRIAAGEARSVKGTVTRSFLDQVGNVAAEQGIRKGTVAGVAQGGRIRLMFSRQFPEGARQRVRNWWGIHGWRPGKARA
jgi:hypothetical protein